MVGLAVGFEPTACRLQGGCTAIVLRKHKKRLTKAVSRKGMKKGQLENQSALYRSVLFFESTIKRSLQLVNMVGNGVDKEAFSCFLHFCIFDLRADAPGIAFDLMRDAVTQSSGLYRTSAAHCNRDFRVTV